MVYKASRDGWMAKDFFRCCSEKGPTLMLIKVSDDSGHKNGVIDINPHLPLWPFLLIPFSSFRLPRLVMYSVLTRLSHGRSNRRFVDSVYR